MRVMVNENLTDTLSSHYCRAGRKNSGMRNLLIVNTVELDSLVKNCRTFAGHLHKTAVMMAMMSAMTMAAPTIRKTTTPSEQTIELTKCY